MNTIKKLQIVSLSAAAVIFMIAVFTKVHVLPNRLFLLMTQGLQRVADTMLLFSIALGVLWLVYKKQ